MQEGKVHFRVLELYCGIGGFHWALKLAAERKFVFEIVAAIDINPVVLEVYKHNFPNINLLNRNMDSLTANEINQMNINMIVMSPPCQPFCRTGLQLDCDDERTNSFQHILGILPEIQYEYLILENVKGFETSLARNILIDTLIKCNFSWQEYLISPTDLGIPNSRLRYYLIAKRQDLNWKFESTDTIQSSIPMFGKKYTDNDKCVVPYNFVLKTHMETWKIRRQEVLLLQKFKELTEYYPLCVADILEVFGQSDNFVVSQSIKTKYEKAMDIVQPLSTGTCCFTKSYGHYVKGTGSILLYNSEDHTDECKTELRFFTPREVLRLMCYPDQFQFPSTVSFKQQYKAVGNSLNPFVVAILITLLTEV